MSWLLFAFAGPVCWAASTHLDKYLVEKYFKNGSTVGLMVFTSVLAALVLPVIWLFYPEVLSMPGRDACLVALTGLLGSVAMVFYLRALQGDEASQVAPFFQMIPVFGFLAAFLLLHELPTAWQALGIVLIISGGAVASVGGWSKEQAIAQAEHVKSARPRLNVRLVVLMLICVAIIATNSVIFKFFAVQDSFWTTAFWQGAGQVIFGLVAMAVPQERRHFITMVRANAGAVLGVNAINEVVNLAGGLAAGFASLSAPVVAIQAISSTTTFFVFVFGVILTTLFPRLGREDLSRANLLRKAAAAVLVTAGAVLIGGGAS